MHQHKLHKKEQSSYYRDQWRCSLLLWLTYKIHTHWKARCSLCVPNTWEFTLTHTHTPSILCVSLFYFWYFTFRIRILMMKKIQRLSIRPQKMHTYNNNNGWIDGWKNNDECFHWEHARTNYRAVRHTHSRTYSVMCVRCTMSLFYVFSRSIVLWCTYA